MTACAWNFYAEAKKLDPKLPEWSELKNYSSEKTNEALRSVGVVREIVDDGNIPDAELRKHGFIKGAVVVRKESSNSKVEVDTKSEYIVGDPEGDRVKLELVVEDADEEEAAVIEIRKVELLLAWRVKPKSD